MKYAYETLLRLYPDSYRVVFGPEMTSVFEQATEDLQSRGVFSYGRFLWTEFIGLIAGAFAMWTDDYMSRSRRKLSGQFVISLVGGAAITIFFHNFFYVAMTRLHIPAEAPTTYPVTSDVMLPVIMAGSVLTFFSVLCAAFVWNMRMIGNRSGRMKPIWMPGRTASSLPARRAACSRRRPHL